MAKQKPPGVIRLRGVRQNNLKGFDLDLPLRQLVVVTGLSGSGKSSLAFETLFAEGQRRFIETFSPYARQFFDRMDKPRVDSIEGIPPAIAVEQRNTVRTTRSTVGTMTEICDHMKLLWPQIARLHCHRCGRLVRRDSPQLVWQACQQERAGQEVLVTFDLPLSEKLSLADSLELIARQGYQRLWREGEVLRVEDAPARVAGGSPAALTVVQDRLRVADANRARFTEACEQAYHFGKGRLSVRPAAGAGETLVFSNRLHCAPCDLEYREPTAALFSYNHPLGACPACKGFGRIISIDYNLVLPDRTKTLAGGVVRPWHSGFSAECQTDMMRFSRKRGVPTDVPFNELEPKWQNWVLEGDEGYGRDAEHEWPRAWYGIKGYFRWLESKTYKMHVRVLLSRYRSYQPCPDCQGRRLRQEALWYTVAPSATARELTLADFYRLPIDEALAFIENLAKQHPRPTSDPVSLLLNEVRSRLGYLVEVGVGYLSLERPTRTLSGGETERVNLTSCLGARLVNTLFVLDEPTVGLHTRDTDRLVRVMQRLRDAGNTVLTVEHEAAVIRAADQVVDLGPGHGESGGEIVFQGTVPQLLKARDSLTGNYLSGRKAIPLPVRRPVVTKGGKEAGWLQLAHARRHNLQDLSVDVPLGRLVCVTGVSGSGKSTLVREVLYPALTARLAAGAATDAASRRLDQDTEADDDDQAEAGPDGEAVLTGCEALGGAILVDQSPLSRTPRSNPAVYVGAFEEIRELFAQSEVARQRGLKSSAFSFNSAQGQCERCRGAGFEKIEMQFLSDVFIRCPGCDGRRYRSHILEVSVTPAETAESSGLVAHDAPAPKSARRGSKARPEALQPKRPALTIADVLELTVDDAMEWLALFEESKPARRARTLLSWVQQVGLGYLRLGQPLNNLSGGESQRLKLASHLAEASGKAAARATQPGAKPTLFLFDEPTTGLHFEDVRILVGVFQQLVELGHSVVVIEHNLELIKCADWVIDLGPEAGDGGGRLVVAGTPEKVAGCAASHTGAALAPMLGQR